VTSSSSPLLTNISNARESDFIKQILNISNARESDFTHHILNTPATSPFNNCSTPPFSLFFLNWCRTNRWCGIPVPSSLLVRRVFFLFLTPYFLRRPTQIPLGAVSAQNRYYSTTRYYPRDATTDCRWSSKTSWCCSIAWTAKQSQRCTCSNI
jgi:hypothetical protein